MQSRASGELLVRLRAVNVAKFKLHFNSFSNNSVREKKEQR